MATKISSMIQIGSTGWNNGKTTLVEALIKQCQEAYPIYGLKVITISGQRGVCQRGIEGCGICTSITAGYELVEEQETTGDKNTMRLLATGCQRVFLLKVFQENLTEAIRQLLRAVPAQASIIYKPNLLRNVVQPGLFLMMNNQNRQRESTKKVIGRADFCLLPAEVPKELRIYYQGEQL